VSWPFGLLFAVGSALASSIGFLLRQRGAVDAPDVDIRSPLRSVVGLFRRRWWTIGYGVALVAWILHVTSLKFAPLSLVQAALASGFVILGVVAERFFGFHLGRRQWVGIALTTVGLALLALTASTTNTAGSHSRYAVVAAIVFEGALVVAGALCLMSHRVRQIGGQSAALMACGAGLLFTVSHIGIKALSGIIDLSRPQTLLTPWVPLIVAAFVGAFFASARSLQIGDGVVVIAITSASSNVTAILGGIVVFSDPIGATPLMVAIRIAAFALVVIAAALIPAPVRAGEAQAKAGRADASRAPGRGAAPARAAGSAA